MWEVKLVMRGDEGAAGGGGITTQGDSFRELDAVIADAVAGYFGVGQRPESTRLHLSQAPDSLGFVKVPRDVSGAEAARALKRCGFA